MLRLFPKGQGPDRKKPKKRPTKACAHGTAHHAVRVSVAGGVIQCEAKGCLCSRRIGEPHTKGLYV